MASYLLFVVLGTGIFQKPEGISGNISGKRASADL